MTSMENKKDSKNKKPRLSDEDILTQVFIQCGRPKDIIKTAVVNVFDNRYRVNVWQSINNPFLPKAGKIVASFFVIVTDELEVKVIN